MINMNDPIDWLLLAIFLFGAILVALLLAGRRG
jgi:hypothetical protein